jgi:hypothetical protein
LDSLSRKLHSHWLSCHERAPTRAAASEEGWAAQSQAQLTQLLLRPPRTRAPSVLLSASLRRWCWTSGMCLHVCKVGGCCNSKHHTLHPHSSVQRPAQDESDTLSQKSQQAYPRGPILLTLPPLLGPMLPAALLGLCLLSRKEHLERVPSQAPVEHKVCALASDAWVMPG